MGNFHIVQIFVDILVIMKISAARISHESLDNTEDGPLLFRPVSHALTTAMLKILDNTPTGILRVDYVGQELYM